MEPKFPSEIVLLATVHGGLLVERVDKALQVATFTVPSGLKITRIMATRPGICNVTNEEQINQVIVDMKQLGSNPEEIGQVVQTIKASQPSAQFADLLQTFHSCHLFCLLARRSRAKG